MTSAEECCGDGLPSLLVQLRESWSIQEVGGTAPATLNQLVQKAEAILAERTSDAQRELRDPSGKISNNSGDNPDSRILAILCNIARFALKPSHEAKARIRTLALDCLRAGVHSVDDESADGVFGLAAMGARDERWVVRAAAARVAGAVLRVDGRDLGGRGAGDRRLLSLISSKNGCWFPAMLVDGHPEVEQRALVAVGSNENAPENDAAGATSTNAAAAGADATSLPPLRSLWSAAASAAAIRSAKYSLLATVAESCDDAVVVDLEVENTARIALRCLRGVCVLGSTVPLSHRPEILTTAVAVEGLEAVETWLASTFKEPPSALGWYVPQPSASTSGAPGAALGAEARDTVRALAAYVGDVVCVEEAAISSVVVFREECCEWKDGAGKEEQKVETETMWRRLYCGLQVRLESLCSVSEYPIASPLPKEHTGLSARGGIQDLAGATPTPAKRSAGDDGFTLISPAIVLAQALDEVPSADERAMPTFHDDDKLSASEKRELTLRGERRRRWIISCAQLLLQSGTRIIGGRGRATATIPIETKHTDAAICLLVVALSFQHSCTRADNPIEAWLSCVRSGPPSIPLAASERSKFPQEGGNEEAATTVAEGAVPFAAAVLPEIAMPIPWKYCVGGQQLHRHELPAPWAADHHTRKLAVELVEACWRRLSLDGTGPAAARASEAMVQALRASARKRGWREGGGVGVKHALANAIRRLRFPLVAGVTLGHLLPLTLPLVDDYDPAHQAVGLSLLLHVVAQATSTELACHRGLLLEVLERGLRGGGRDTAASTLCLAAALALLRESPVAKDELVVESTASTPGDEGVGRAGIRIAQEALSQGGRTTDGEVRVVMVAGAAAFLELPSTVQGYAPCKILRPALLTLLPILQSPVTSTRLDARPAALRALHALCLACWPRVHAHAVKLLCTLLWTCGDCARRREHTTTPTVDVADHPPGSILSADETVEEYTKKLGALVLVLTGDAGRSTLREACEALSALRRAGIAMEELAYGARMPSEDRRELGVRGRARGDSPDRGVPAGGVEL